MGNNRSNFEQFLKDEQPNVSFDDANKYADIGDELIKIAMTSDDNNFNTDLKNLEDKLKELKNNDKYLHSNMASCLLYAQSRANFSLNQGYAKGSNINQYGDNATSEKTVNRLTSYFMNSGKGYDRPSTHGKWATKQIIQKFGIDLPSEEGAIPPPQKRIHHLHFVAGKDNDGTKMLIKPENWGFNTLYHKFKHSLDWLMSRFKSDHVKGYDQRQETKFNKESSVQQIADDLGVDIKINSNDKSLKDLLMGISRDLKTFKSEKGLDCPLQTLKSIDEKLGMWIEKNSDHQEIAEVKTLRNNVEQKIIDLNNEKIDKYCSNSQCKSEVRLKINIEDDKVNYGKDINSELVQKINSENLRIQQNMHSLSSPLTNINPLTNNLQSASVTSQFPPSLSVEPSKSNFTKGF